MEPSDVSTPFTLSGEPRTRWPRSRLLVVGLLGVAALSAVVAVVVSVSPRSGSSTLSSSASNESTRQAVVEVVEEEAVAPVSVQAEVPPAMNFVEGFASGGGSANFHAHAANEPVLIRSVLQGDVDTYTELKSRFTSQFSQRFVDYANSLNPKDSSGNPLHFTHAVILGFPPTPVPTSGHVTHDFMTQTGGLHVKEKVPITFAKYDPQYTPTLVNSVLFKQDSPDSSTHKLTYSESFTSSQTMSVTTGVSTSVSSEVSVEVPGIAGAKLSTTMTASMSTTASNTETTTNTWGSEEDITIPAHSVTNGTCFLSKGTVTTAFSGVLTVTDDSNIGWVFYDDREHTGSDPWFWFWQDKQTGAGLRQAIQWSGSSLSLDFDVSGVFKGVAGSEVQCEVHACKYQPGLDRCTHSNI